jgi:hypothetical protein
MPFLDDVDSPGVLLDGVGLDCAKELQTDAGTAEMAAIANAKAVVILMNMVILPCVEARSGFRGLDRATRRLFLRSYSPAEEFGDEAVTVTSSRRSEKMSGCFKRRCRKDRRGGQR